MQKLTREQIIVLLKESKEQALKNQYPRSYMYPILLTIIQDAYDLDQDEELASLYHLAIVNKEFKK